MTTVNNMSQTDDLSLLFAGRDYINSLGGEHRFKEYLANDVIKDDKVAHALVDIFVKTSPNNYVYFYYIGRRGRRTAGIRFYYLINHPATTKLNVYRKNAEDPLENNCRTKCYVIVEYKKKPNVEFLAISAIVRKSDIDTFHKKEASVDAYDGHHVA
jgi:hypothetical protein